MKFSPFNFGAIEKQSFGKAKIVILPIPFEETTDERKGTIAGPEAIISASRDLDELWQSKVPIFTFDEIELEGETIKEKMDDLRNFIIQILGEKKIPILIGGEHTISFGSILAFRKKYQNFSVLHLDAHSDCLDEYKKSKLNYATVMRRIRESGVEIVSVGVRSVDKKTSDYLRKKKIKIFPSAKIPLKRILKELKKNVYFSLDLDVLDPSIMPSVSNPVPGGLKFEDLITLFEKLAKDKKIIGGDVVEFCPISGFLAPDVLVAKLIYKILDLILKQKERKI
jgi:agmatinase